MRGCMRDLNNTVLSSAAAQGGQLHAPAQYWRPDARQPVSTAAVLDCALRVAAAPFRLVRVSLLLCFFV